MCEHCTGTKISGKDLGPGERTGCQRFIPPNEEEASSLGQECGKLAAYVVRKRYVEEHLCAEHVEEEDEAIHDGLGDFMRELGIQESCEFLPIRQEATCDGLGNLLSGASLERCARRATYAKLVVEESVVCAQHAQEIGCCPR